MDKTVQQGRAKSKPKVAGKTVYVKSTLFTFRDGKLKISIEPGKRHLEVNLARYDYLPRDFDAIGGLPRENGLIVNFKKKWKAEASIPEIGLRSTQTQPSGRPDRRGSGQVRPQAATPRPQGLRGEEEKNTEAIRA